MAKDEYGHMSVGELKAFVKKYKKVHCKPFSKLDRAGLIALTKEIEAHERKVEVVPKLSVEEVEKVLQAKKARRKKKEKNVVVKVEEKKEVVEKKEEPVKKTRKPNEALKNVQALRKARNVSLKEAWALHKAGEKVGEKKRKVIKIKKTEEQKN
jgi:hypothetical protein